MANIREIKVRMKSIKETRQITKAMKLISTAKLRNARKLLEQSLPYFDKVKSTIVDILTHSSGINSPYFELRHDKENRKKAYLIITGDKGMAGGYTHNIISLTENVLNESHDSLLMVAGSVGRNYFLKNRYNVYEEFDYPVHDPTVFRAREISEIILKLFKNGEFDEFYIIYTEMSSSIALVPKVIKLLPLDPDTMARDLGISENHEKHGDSSLKYGPSVDVVFNILISKYVKGIVYGTFVESYTSEQNARMAAMDNATANADEMLEKLDLSYNRARQSSITQEISEIVGGASALNG